MLENIGKLLLRVVLGGMMLFHGVDKVVHGISYIKGLVRSQGLPEVWAYGVYVGEVLAPVLLIVGWRSRVWAGVIAFNMAAAIYLVHRDDLLKLGEHGAWAVEVQMFYLLSAVVILFVGSGRYALRRD